jgi:hypothetical protein
MGSSPKFAGIQAAVRAALYQAPRGHNLRTAEERHLLPFSFWSEPPAPSDLNLSAQEAQWWAHGETEWAAAEKVAGHGTGSVDAAAMLYRNADEDETMCRGTWLDGS